MLKFEDVTGRVVHVGSRVGVGFSYNTSGRIRVGVVESLEPEFTVRWDVNDKVSPPLRYDLNRIILL